MLAKMGFKPGSQGLGKNNQGSVATKILEERSVKSLVEVENLYQSSTTLGLEPVSIINYTRPGSSIKRPTQN